jgi:DNA-binding MarR family transcriptional regulator
MMVERRRQFSAQPLHRGFSMVQMYILMALQERGALTMSEVALLLQVAAPSASAIVDRMEEHDLVRRIRSESDRRVVRVEIAQAGRDAVQRVMGLRAEEIRAFLDTMSAEELETVVAGLRTVRTAVARSRGHTSPHDAGPERDLAS